MGKLGRLSVVAVALALALASGCSEEYSDEAFGVLDLAPVYDGGTASDPTAGLPQQLDPETGYLDGARAEYYDFGVVAARTEPRTGQPRGVVVQPMYFFFRKSDGYPYFGKPVREMRDGSDWMLGGKSVRNPNPKNFCDGIPEADRPGHPCTDRNKQERTRSYSARQRDLLVDPGRPGRHTSDYQRPIVDVNPTNLSPNVPQYTGFWEIVEVLAPNDYAPDSIKHLDTLDRAVKSGGFKVRNTGKVIDCPVIDERTHVSRGVTDRPTPRPRVELWYRRQLAYCYLAHGWETLGNESLDLFYAGQDEERVDTFDVDRVVLGEGKDRENRLVVPIGRGYVPAIFTSDQSGSPPDITRIVDNLLTRGRPRHFKNDPPGYTPVRWMWDFVAPPDYQSGALKSVDQVDPEITRAQRRTKAGGPLVIRNIPLRGVATPCSLPPTTKLSRTQSGFQCGRLVPDPNDPGTDSKVVDARNDPECTKLGLECNKDTCFCDAPFVGYGQSCGPGIAQCNGEADKLSENGYTCFPPFGGFCHVRCNPGQPNTRAPENEGKKLAQFVDTRCKALSGYACLRYQDAGICLKFCDLNVTEGNQCTAETQVDTEVQDIGAGQSCQDWGLEICTWPENYTPAQ